MIQLIRGDNDCCNLIEKRYYDRYFADDLFKFTSLYENGFLLILRNWFPTHIIDNMSIGLVDGLAMIR